MKEGWMKSDEGWMKSDEGWMKNDERWRMNDAVWWFQAVEGFWLMTDGRTNERTDICDCRVAFATENIFYRSLDILYLHFYSFCLNSMKKKINKN